MNNDGKKYVQGNEPSFSLYDFSNWLNHQKPMKENAYTSSSSKIVNEKIIDTLVTARLGEERLIKQIKANNPEIQENKINEIANEFKHNGGKIISSEDLNVIVEVSCGKFSIPSAYVKKAKT